MACESLTCGLQISLTEIKDDRSKKALFPTTPNLRLKSDHGRQFQTILAVQRQRSRKTDHGKHFQLIPAVQRQRSFRLHKGRDQGRQIKEGIVSNHSPIKADQGRHFQQIPSRSAKAEIKEGIVSCHSPIKTDQGGHFQQIPTVQR